MSAIEIYQKFIKELSGTTLLEFVAVVAGIVSVWFSKKENIWVYPTGLINTVAFVYISIKGQLFGEASVNIFYTIMSIYGWILWAKKDQQNQQVLVIKYSSVKEWLQHLLCFAAFYIAIYTALTYLQNREFAPHAMPAADAFASASAYTGMLLMARKKVESWLWWIVTNIASIPLYFVKGYVFTSFQFIVLLVMAFMGWAAWHKKAKYARA